MIAVQNMLQNIFILHFNQSQASMIWRQGISKHHAGETSRCISGVRVVYAWDIYSETCL